MDFDTDCAFEEATFNDYYMTIRGVLSEYPDLSQKIVEFGCMKSRFVSLAVDENQVRFVDSLIEIDQIDEPRKMQERADEFEPQAENYKIRDFKLNIFFYLAKKLGYDSRIFSNCTTIVALDYVQKLESEALTEYIDMVCGQIQPNLFFVSAPLKKSTRTEPRQEKFDVEKTALKMLCESIVGRYPYELISLRMFEPLFTSKNGDKCSQIAVLKIKSDWDADDLLSTKLHNQNPAGEYQLIRKIELPGKSRDHIRQTVVGHVHDHCMSLLLGGFKANEPMKNMKEDDLWFAVSRIMYTDGGAKNKRVTDLVATKVDLMEHLVNSNWLVNFDEEQIRFDPDDAFPVTPNKKIKSSTEEEEEEDY